MQSSALQIGEVAARAEVSIDAVRYYEKRGLIQRASRSSGGFRLFALETVERIKFIKQAQELGFSLDEIREILSNGDGLTECLRVRDFLKSKLGEIEDRMRKMREFSRVLKKNLESCELEIIEHGKDAHCPVIVNIERGNQTAIQKESYEQK